MDQAWGSLLTGARATQPVYREVFDLTQGRAYTCMYA